VPRPDPAEERVDISIGTISVTLEAPPARAKPPPPPAAPAPAPLPRTGYPTDRLRRRFIRV
jgi:hypothetical protein